MVMIMLMIIPIMITITTSTSTISISVPGQFLEQQTPRGDGFDSEPGGAGHS